MSGRWLDDLEQRARANLPPHVWRYFTTGALDGVSAAEATAAWESLRFMPRVLRDVRRPQTATTLLGTEVRAPIAIAPTSLQKLADPEGEVAMARGCAAAGSLMVVSTNAGSSFEDIATTGASWWLQVYLTQDRSHTEPVLERAVSAGAKAIVLTVDTPFPGPKHDLDDADFGDLTAHWRVNHVADSIGAKTAQPAGHEHARDIGGADIAWLAERTGLPVVVKGVLRPDDARRCVSAGASAVWVSNHGGRQLDRSVATATALPGIVAAVGASTEVYVDGGLRSGLDLLAALALGARACFLGRPPLHALADRGSTGVEELLIDLSRELVDALVLAGCRTPNDTVGVLFWGSNPL